MATLKSNLKEALGGVLCTIGCIGLMVLVVCVWGVQFAGLRVAIHAVWPTLGDAASPLAAIVGLAMTLLMVFGAEAAKNMIEDEREKRRKLRLDAIARKQTLWLAGLGNIREKPGWDLEDIYWDGIELLDQFTRNSNLTEKQRAFKNKGFNQALEDLATALKEKGLDVGHKNTKSDESHRGDQTMLTPSEIAELRQHKRALAVKPLLQAIMAKYKDLEPPAQLRAVIEEMVDEKGFTSADVAALKPHIVQYMQELTAEAQRLHEASREKD